MSNDTEPEATLTHWSRHYFPSDMLLYNTMLALLPRDVQARPSLESGWTCDLLVIQKKNGLEVMLYDF